MRAVSAAALLLAVAVLVVDGGTGAGAGGLHPKRFELLSTTSEEVEAFLDSMKDAVERSDAAGLAELIEFPMWVGSCDGEQMVEGAEGLRLLYSELMDEGLRQAIMEQSVDELAVSWQGMMIASGRLWFTVVCDRESESGECLNQRTRIIRINYNCAEPVPEPEPPPDGSAAAAGSRSGCQGARSP